MRGILSVALGGLVTLVGAQNYTERYRPQYHWTPAKNWMNDANGLIYHKGQYHMYYQYNPTGDVWGNISWGHAISTDLMHWKEQPIALNAFDSTAGSLNEFFFSGSAVYDKNNSSGFGNSTQAPLVAIYTSYYPKNVTLPTGRVIHKGTQAQSIAYSVDDGLTWTEYAGNPVIPVPPHPYEDQWDNFRDPFVFWHEQSQHWVMVSSLAAIHKFLIWTSKDLKNWKLGSEFGPVNANDGLWECPNLFPLPLNGNESNIKWVLMAGIQTGGPAFNTSSATQYFVGSFNGTKFTADASSVYTNSSGKANWLDYGPDFYAAATYNGLDNYERIAITWMSDWDYALVTPTSPWRSAMAIPRKLTLQTLGGQSRLISIPQHNLQSLEHRPLLYSNQWESTASGNMVIPVSGKALDINLTFSPGNDSEQMSINVRTNGKNNGTSIGYDFTTQQMFVDRDAAGDNSSFSPEYKGKFFAPLKSNGGAVSMRVLLDWSSVEVFGGKGESTITAQIFPMDANTGISLMSDGDAKNVKIQIEEVVSVWTTASKREDAPEGFARSW